MIADILITLLVLGVVFLVVIGIPLRLAEGRFPTSFLLDHLRGIKELDSHVSRQDLYRGMEYGDFKITLIQHQGWVYSGGQEYPTYRVLGRRFRATTPSADLRTIYNLKGW